VIAFGAGVAMAAELRDLAAYVLLYPGCENLPSGLADGAGPLMIVHGAMDAANATDSCAAAAGSLAASGRSVQHLVYEGAGYAWDHPPYGLEYRFMLPRPDGRGRVQAVPWAELAWMSAAQVAGFVAVALAR
jgi:dienelactone hydrolase